MTLDTYLSLCAPAARAVLERWAAASLASTGHQDRFTDPETSTTYRWEPVKLHADGAATGKVWRGLGGLVEEVEGNGWRVEPDGRVTRAPRFLALVAARAARTAQEPTSGVTP